MDPFVGTQFTLIKGDEYSWVKIKLTHVNHKNVVYLVQ